PIRSPGEATIARGQMNARVARFCGKVATLIGCGFMAFGVLLTLLSLVVDVPWGQMTGRAVLEQSITVGFLILAGLFRGVLVLIKQHDALERSSRALEQRAVDIEKEPDPGR